MQFIDITLATNQMILNKYASSNIKFEIVNVMEDNEKWQPPGEISKI